MTQRKLIIGSCALFAALGVFLFVASGNVQANHVPSPSPTPSPTVSPSPAPSPTSSPTATISPSPTSRLEAGRTSGTAVTPTPTSSISPTPTASYNFTPGSNRLAIHQINWNRADASTDPFTAEDLPAFTGKPNQCKENLHDAGTAKDVTWDKYLVATNLKFSNSGAELNGKTGGGTLISNGFTSDTGSSVEWVGISVRIKGSAQLFYRISDTEVTDDPADSSWIALPNNAGGNACGAPSRQFRYRINRAGKYLQYKLQIPAQSQVRRLSIYLRDATIITPSPSPTVSPSPTSSPSGITAGHGKVTIVTKKLIIPSASPTPPGPPLPETSPTPSPSPVTSGSPRPVPINPLCFSDQETDAAVNVRLSLKQTQGGKTLIEDQVTNDQGIWQGIDNGEDEIPTGTYIVNFGDFQKSDYKLVALCVTPDDGQHHLKTQTTPTGSKATIIVKDKEETKITALYAPRDKPYISMNKFAINSQNKVVKVLYPGQPLRYLVRYENTGGADAKEVVIRDVIPEQYYVVEPDTFVDEATDFLTAPDSQGRTVITKKIKEIPRGKKGSFVIPVVLRPDAFGTPEDIAGFIDQQKEAINKANNAAGTQSEGASNSEQ